MNIAGLLSHHARYRPDRPAVVCGGTRLNFREFEEKVNRTANALLGIQPNRVRFSGVMIFAK